MSSKKFPWLLWLIVIIGAFFRFYKLDWGSGYFFHPDEYHITGSVNQLVFPSQMNPHLFSYGSLIVYLIFFTQKLIGGNPFLIGRFYSAFFSTFSILIIYVLTKKLLAKTNLALLAAFLTAVLPGLIQQAHFATPESILTFWLLLTLWLILNRRFLFSAASLGLAIASKIVALTYLPLLIVSVIIFRRKIIKNLLLSLIILLVTYFIVSPYSFFDYASFRNTINYESGVGLGKPIVFYTRQFVNTVPILFQYLKILPYALGLPILILGTLGLILFSLKIKNKNYLLITLAFSFYFFPNAFLFVKWTRFMSPIFPFFVIFTVYFLAKIRSKSLLIICYLLLVTNIVWSLIFFSLYLKPDIRITTTKWINQNIPQTALILTEAGNMLEVPLSGQSKLAFDFYNLEENRRLQEELPINLVKVDYFIIQSRRIFTNHQRLADEFPITARFYQRLFSNQLGFSKIKEFNPWSPIKFSDEQAEETWAVFDHPVIRIYKKVKPYTVEEYEKMLRI